MAFLTEIFDRARNPIPRMNDDNRGLHDPSSCPGPTSTSGPGCLQFPAPCPQDTGRFPWSTDGSVRRTVIWVAFFAECQQESCGQGQGECSSDWTAGSIADRVIIPKTLPAGDYVLGWRCADSRKSLVHDKSSSLV